MRGTEGVWVAGPVGGQRPSVLGELTPHLIEKRLSIGGEFLLRADGHWASTTRAPARGGSPEEGGTWLAAGQGVPPTGAERRWGMAALMPYDPVGA